MRRRRCRSGRCSSTTSRSPSRPSLSSTPSSRRAPSTATPERGPCCTGSGTTSSSSRRTSSAARVPLDIRRLRWTIAAAAAAVAAWGLVEVYAVPIEWWRHSGAVGYFHRELGYDYHGPAGLPGELRLQHQRRALPPARLDVRLAARDRLHARRRAAPARDGPAPAAARRRAGRGLRRRAALDVLALVDRRARGRARRARRSPGAAGGRCRRGRRRRRRVRLRRDLPRDRAAHALVRVGSPVPAGAGEGERPPAEGERARHDCQPRRAVDPEPP